MRRSKLLSRIYRARRELDGVAQELQAMSDDETTETDKDLLEVRARVDALDVRVTAIEERGST